MFHAILVVLKILGLILLFVLGLLLVLILIVALVPVRYRFFCEKYDKAKAKFKVSWLLHIVTISVSYEDEKLVRSARLFGIVIWGDGKKTFKKKKKVSVKGKRKSARGNQKTEDSAMQNIATEDLEDFVQEDTLPEDNISKFTSENDVSKSRLTETDSIGNDTNKKRKNGKIKGFYLKLKELLRKIQYTISHIYDKMNEMKERFHDFIILMEKESTKAALARCKKELIRIFKHIKPRHISGKIAFGAENPEMTGKIFGMYGMLYAFLGKKISLVPYFEEEILEGEIYFRGHITMAVLLMIALRVYFDKNIREFMHAVRKEG